MKLIDYSFARPDPAYIKAQGFGGVMRYLSHSTSKNLSIAERDRLLTAGLAIGLVWETTANRALDGYNAGVQDARDALNQANTLGYNGVIYFAVDFDATPAQQTPINEYLKGAKTILSDRVGVYGGYWVVKRCFDAGIIKWGWQTYAWSGGNWDQRAQIRQVKNGQWNDQVDFNETTTDNWGGINIGGNMDNTLTPDQARIVYQNALLREPENEQVIQGRHFDEMMGGVKIELSQRFSEIQNKPAIIQTIYVDKPVEVPVDITTDEEKKTWMEEYAKNNPPIVMVRDMSPIEAIKVLWNAIINYLTKTKE